ncbi:unnamed protein product [Didymodactylos carnosus]|uniref:Uncharacterized protein n=1 Tax=Didymodactylos carnosus TaxID=1234261 RepID=A0A814X720_9BILA|nr:unnamed protein product [Didymodactylos carnosus]CAF1212255.1 unnamed protein product [Didymodactylos carnosus]CAF3672184.1 unnamed protein product [Didymodactylos carnosus]CAF3976245.1 unnamed protein product [Didymodactylos carnosus]
MPEAEKQPYNDIANRLRAKHKAEHPNYRYQTKRVKKCARHEPYSIQQKPVQLCFRVHSTAASDSSISTLEERLKRNLQSIDQSLIPYIQNYPVIVTPPFTLPPPVVEVSRQDPQSSLISHIISEEQQQSSTNLCGDELIGFDSQLHHLNSNESSVELSPLMSNQHLSPCSTEFSVDELNTLNEVLDNLTHDWPTTAANMLLSPTWLSNEKLTPTAHLDDYLSFL